MALIFETDKFMVVAHDQPHHDRDNGGHLKIFPKTHYRTRIEMPMDEYLAMMSLVKIAGEAVIKIMREKGIDVVRINYQDNGNWSYFPEVKKDPLIHVHLYVRSNNEKHPTNDERFRAFPEALNFPYKGSNPEYYVSFKPYSAQDCREIGEEIGRLLKTDKYMEIKERL